MERSIIRASALQVPFKRTPFAKEVLDLADKMATDSRRNEESAGCSGRSTRYWRLQKRTRLDQKLRRCSRVAPVKGANVPIFHRVLRMLQCPKCGSPDTRQSRSRWIWESWRSQITATCPYRCAKCGTRGWAPVPTTGLEDSRPQLPEMPAPPRMQEDIFPAPPPSFHELDLWALDIPRKPLSGRLAH
jgi:hypothetical protein